MVTASAEMEQEESTKCNVSGDNKEWNSYTKPGYLAISLFSKTMALLCLLQYIANT